MPPENTTATAPVAKGRKRGRPTKAEGIKLREQLLKVATKVFLAHGYAGASIDAIALRSKIGKMTIYRHFPSKEQLFRAVVLRASERMKNDFAGIQQDNREVRDVLSDFIMASYDDPASDEMLGITRIVIAEGRRLPDLTYAIYQQRREMLRPLTDYLARMSAEGVLAVKEAELAAFQLVALASGGIRALMIPREAIDAGRAQWTAAALTMFLDGVRVHPDAPQRPKRARTRASGKA